MFRDVVAFAPDCDTEMGATPVTFVVDALPPEGHVVLHVPERQMFVEDTVAKVDVCVTVMVPTT